ncbi:MAG: HD domain-containing protein, partial [Amphiplicatus sp.]
MAEPTDGYSEPADTKRPVTKDDPQNAKKPVEADPEASRKLRAGAPQAAPGGSPAEPHSSANAQAVAAPAAATHPVGFIRQYELVDRVKAYDPQADEDLLNRAYVFAMKAHGGQTRKSGDPYFTHPLSVASILTELKADPATVATALLHDVVEDTETTVDDIRRLFGDEIARLV